LAEFTFFASPLFDHDAFMHHALQVLDAQAGIEVNALSISRNACKITTPYTSRKGVG